MWHSNLVIVATADLVSYVTLDRDYDNLTSATIVVGSIALS